MITRLLAGLIVTCAVSIGVAAAEEERGAKPAGAAPAVSAAEKPEGRKIEWDDADATPDEKAVKPKSAERPDAKSEGAPASAKSNDTAASEKSAAADKPSESAKPKDQPAPAGSAKSAASEKPATVTTTEATAAKRVNTPSGGKPARISATEREPARERLSLSESRVRASRSTTADSLAPRQRAVSSRDPAPIRTAQAIRRPAPLETGPVAMDVAARQGTPISGGILCGGASKWRCNWIEREHDKFYKFTKGHNWTDQTMATDYCASEKSMRVASATRVKSIQAGCCGFVIVQVTCRR